METQNEKNNNEEKSGEKKPTGDEKSPNKLQMLAITQVFGNLTTDEKIEIVEKLMFDVGLDSVISNTWRYRYNIVTSKYKKMTESCKTLKEVKDLEMKIEANHEAVKYRQYFDCWVITRCFAHRHLINIELMDQCFDLFCLLRDKSTGYLEEEMTDDSGYKSEFTIAGQNYPNSHLDKFDANSKTAMFGLDRFIDTPCDRFIVTAYYSEHFIMWSISFKNFCNLILCKSPLVDLILAILGFKDWTSLPLKIYDDFPELRDEESVLSLYIRDYHCVHRKEDESHKKFLKKMEERIPEFHMSESRMFDKLRASSVRGKGYKK